MWYIDNSHFTPLTFTPRSPAQSFKAKYKNDKKTMITVDFHETEEHTYSIQFTFPDDDDQESLTQCYTRLQNAGFFNYPTLQSSTLQKCLPLTTEDPSVLATFIRIITSCYPPLKSLNIIDPEVSALTSTNMPRYFQQDYVVNNAPAYLSYAFSRSLLTRIVISPKPLNASRQNNTVFSTHISGRFFLCLEFGSEETQTSCHFWMNFFTCNNGNPISQCCSALSLDAAKHPGAIDVDDKNMMIFKENLQRKLVIVQGFFSETAPIIQKLVENAGEKMPHTPIIKHKTRSDEILLALHKIGSICP